ncbi:MAG: ubiquitin-like protein Pup [Acidimicrobiales bacterium 20-64-4]|nr:MAG: ubiquitin-like protein Pup [Acidimicrobiales bacterium 20-64-4]
MQKQRTERTESSAATDDVAVDAQKGEQLKAELDDLLDEIDEVLEQNAEEFVRNYVQKGGQ